MKISKNLKAVDGVIIKLDEVPEVEVDGYYSAITPKLIKYIEKLCRGSFEYKSLIEYLKNNLNVDRCSYFEGYSIHNGFSIEFHHHPFTLYDIVETVCNKHMELSENGKINDMEVCRDVMELHFMFYVGLIPVNPTVHEAIHSGKIFCHPDMVLGNWKGFKEEYGQYFSDRVKDKIEEIEAIAESTNPTETPKNLEEKPVFIDYKRESLLEFDFVNIIKIE